MYPGIAVTTPVPKLPSFLLIQEHPIVSADSESSQPYPDSVRHLPDSTGVWSAVVLAGPEADAVEDAHSSFHETRTPHKVHRDLETQCVCDLVCVRVLQSRHDMVVALFCGS